MKVVNHIRRKYSCKHICRNKRYYVLTSLSRFDRKKPSDARIQRMTKRQRKFWAVKEFTQYYSIINFKLTNGMPITWETCEVDLVYDILQKYHLDTTLSWDEDWSSLQNFKLSVYNDHNPREKLTDQFLRSVADEINCKVFHGEVGDIELNIDGMWSY